MSFRPLPTVLRTVLALLLLLAFAGCSVYNRVVHPYRLPTPEAPPEFKRQQKAKALKAREGSKAAAKAKAAGNDAPAADAAPDAGADAGAESKAKPPASDKKVKFDKDTGLMKKPKLIRRRYHKPVGKGFHPLDGTKNFFKNLFRGKPNQKPSGKGKQDPATAPDAVPDPAGP